jgi:glutamyl-tRNA synthetase
MDASDPSATGGLQRVTRLAPSPTGALHLGNARTFLVNWAMARQRGWRVVLRIEDLDTPRVKAGADRQAIGDLRWLGLDWDEGPVYQACDPSPYHTALKRLDDAGLIYPCCCSRREIAAAASAPQEGEHELRYPGTCRPMGGGRGHASAPAAAAWRVIVPDGPVAFHDEARGEYRVDVQAQVGDFVVRTKEGLPSYQLAVVVDDARQGVTDVVRGDDLLDSTGRQILLHRMLGLDDPNGAGPRWWHLPLVRGSDGRRLAKRHGDTRVAMYRELGVDPRRLVGLLAAWSGVCDTPAPMSADAFAGHFAIERLPRRDIIFRPEDDAWLRDVTRGSHG